MVAVAFRMVFCVSYAGVSHVQGTETIPTRLRRGRSRWVNVLLLSLVVVFGFLCMEPLSRYLWHRKYIEMLEKKLHGIDHVDYEKAILIPTPDTTVTVQDYRNGLEGHGKRIGLAYLDYYIDRYGLNADDVILRINHHGFKGPDIQTTKEDTTFRILAVGDSCTWGPALDRYAYPRILERELNAWDRTERIFEVINAGVYGYNIQSLLKRADDFLAVEPDLILIYIGWNQTIARADHGMNRTLYRTFDLYKIYYHLVRNPQGGDLAGDFWNRTYYDKTEKEALRLAEYDFRYDMNDLMVFVRKARERNRDVRIMMITLAGLFDARIDPDQAALKAAYPIASTNNLYAWSLLTKGYNEALRQLAVEEGLDIIDFEQYVFENIDPRSGFFTDSVHPTTDGFGTMALFLAEELKEHLAPSTS